MPFFNIRIIHGALCMGALMFGIVTIGMLVPPGEGTFGMTDTVGTLLAVYAGVCLLAMIVGVLVYKFRMRSARKLTDIAAMQQQYLSASIVKWALLEGAVLFGFVQYITFQNYFFYVLALAMWLVLLLNFPSKDRFALDAELSQEQRQGL